MTATTARSVTMFPVAGRRGGALPQQTDDEGCLDGVPLHVAPRLRVS